MPNARLTKAAEKNLLDLDVETRTVAIETIHHLEKHPGEGAVVSPLQYSIDPTLPKPATVYVKRLGRGRSLFVYYEVEGGELKISIHHCNNHVAPPCARFATRCPQS